jgi:hypothetical protein
MRSLACDDGSRDNTGEGAAQATPQPDLHREQPGALSAARAPQIPFDALGAYAFDLRIGFSPTRARGVRAMPGALEPRQALTMSAVLVAVFSDHAIAEAVRIRLVKDGFPTDRVELTSCQELGQAELAPRGGLGDKLTEYFRSLFESGNRASDERTVQLFQRAVLDGNAALAVHPRGDIETKRALQLLNEGDPVEVRGADLQSQTLEHAATEAQTPIVTWVGKVLAAPGAADTTGMPRLP